MDSSERQKTDMPEARPLPRVAVRHSVREKIGRLSRNMARAFVLTGASGFACLDVAAPLGPPPAPFVKTKMMLGGWLAAELARRIHSREAKETLQWFAENNSAALKEVLLEQWKRSEQLCERRALREVAETYAPEVALEFNDAA